MEEIALDWKNRCNTNWSPPFLDRAFQLLERKHRVGGDKLRKVVAKLLSKEPKETLTTHKALLDLSDTASGFRLVTTNFDNRFCQAACQYGVKLPPIDIAPRLPVANPDRWSSIVHLHGSISSSSLKDLVLTSADFGRAYMTHGWAAKFLIDMFRHYTVIFAGYSIEDPVMRYLIDAISAHPREEFHQAFVFAPFNGEYGSETETRDRWKSMGVEPIQFNCKDDFRYLNETLIEWARIYKNPLQARKKIVLDGIRKFPGSRTEPIVERVLWALQDLTDIADELVENSKIEYDNLGFTQVASWLDIFFEEGFIGGQCKEDNLGNSQTNNFEQMTECWKTISKYRYSEEVEWRLIRWVLKRLHIPQVFSSVCFYYCQLPSKYIETFKISLIKYRKEIPNHLWCLWFTLLHDGYPRPSVIKPILHYYNRPNFPEIERCLIEDRLIKCIAPKFIIKYHPTQKFLESYFSGEKQFPTQRDEVDIQAILVFGEEKSWSDIKDIFETDSFRARNAEILTDYLEQAIKLIRVVGSHASKDDLGNNSFDLYINRPLIADNKQNERQTECMKFVNCVRDSYFDLVKVDKNRAEHLLQRWIRSGEPLFKRLALHAITVDRNADTKYIRLLLLEGKNPGLLDQELNRETLRFLNKPGLSLPEDIRKDISKMIHANILENN